MNWEAIIASLVAVVTFFWGVIERYQRYRLEKTATSGDYVQDMVAASAELITMYRQRIDELVMEVAKLEARVCQLENALEAYSCDVEDCPTRQQISRLTKRSRDT